MSTEEVRTKKSMTPQAKSVNIAIQLILLVVVVYIITRTVNHVGVVLFTWHPVFVSIGVSWSASNLPFLVPNYVSIILVSSSHVTRDFDDGR